MSALLLARGLTFSKHSGALKVFNKEFVKTGKIDRELGKFYNRMFEHRLRGDYGEVITFGEKEVKDWLGTAEKFLNVINKLLGGQPPGTP